MKFIKLMLQMLSGAVFGFFSIWMMLDYFHFNVSFFSIVWLVVFFIISHYLAIIVHESGHIIAGKRKGMEFYFFLLGPLFIYKDDKQKRHITFQSHGLKLAGAASLRADVHEKRAALEKQVYSFILGGGLANILVGVISFIGAFAFSSVFLFIFSLINLFVGPMNLLMKESPDFIPDGGMLHQLKHNPIKKEVLLVTHLIHATVRTSIHEWPKDLVERAEKALLSEQYTINSASLASALSYYYIGKGESQQAKALLQPFVEAAPTKKTRSFIWNHLDVLYIISCYLLDQKTEEWDTIKDRIVIRDNLTRDKLAFLQFAWQSDFKKAEKQLDNANQLCEEWSFLYGNGKLEKELLDTLKIHLEKQKKAHSS